MKLKFDERASIIKEMGVIMFSLNQFQTFGRRTVFKNGLESTKTSWRLYQTVQMMKYGFCLFDYEELTATIIALEYSDKHVFTRVPYKSGFELCCKQRRIYCTKW